MREVLTQGGPLEVSVVYSGGDDVFLIGAWNPRDSRGAAVDEQLRRLTAVR